MIQKEGEYKVLVTQTFPKGYDPEKQERRYLKTAAFRDWQHKLKRGDQLPRGKFFKGKKAGKPIILMDEAWMLLNGTSMPHFPHTPTDDGFDVENLTIPSMNDNRSMIKTCMFGHLFDKEVGCKEIEFDKLIVDVNEANKHFVIPMLLKLAERAEQEQKIREICERVDFDITCLEHGVIPETQGKA